MQSTALLYHDFSKLMDYPDQDFAKHLQSCLLLLEKDHPNRTHELIPFAHNAKQMPLTELEEYYTRTFDINPVTALEIGWHLYGESYERGAFLVKMRGLSREYHLSESSELPDHLTHILNLLGSMGEKEAQKLSEEYFLPGINKIISAFEKKENIFEALLVTIKNVIQDRNSNISKDQENG